MYGPTLSSEIVTTIFLRFEELLRKAGKMDMFETLVYNYRLKDNLPFQCLQHFASILNDLIRQLTELSVALEAGTHMSQSLHKTDYECGPDCEAVVNRFCLMESLLESNDLADFTMNCPETELCEPTDGDDATVDLIGETVAMLGESDILTSRQHPGVESSPSNGHEILLPIPNSESMPCTMIADGLMELSTNVCNDLPVGIQSLECNQSFLSGENLVSNQNVMIPDIRNSENFNGESGNFQPNPLDVVIECDEAFIAVADEVLKMRQESLARSPPENEIMHKKLDPLAKQSGKDIKIQQPKPVQCKQCGKTFLTEKGLKSHEGLTHKRSPEALAKQRKEEELILQKIGVLTGVSSPKINQSASFQEITTAATNNLNKSITNSQKRALASSQLQKETKVKPLSKLSGKDGNFKSHDLVQCHQCGKTFMTEKGLKSHEGLVHKKATTVTTSENGNLKREANSSKTGEKVVQMPSQCKTCGKTFMTEKGLKSHEGLVHKKAQGDKFKSQAGKHIAVGSNFIKTPDREITNAVKIIKSESGEGQKEKRNSKDRKSSTSTVIEVIDLEQEFLDLQDAVGSPITQSINSKKVKSHQIHDIKKVRNEIQKLPSETKQIEFSRNSKSGGFVDRLVVPRGEIKKEVKKEKAMADVNAKCKLENGTQEKKHECLVEPPAIRKGLRKREKPKHYEDIATDTKRPRHGPILQKTKSVTSETSSDFTSDDDIPWLVCEKCVLTFKTVKDFQKHTCSFLGEKFEFPMTTHSMAYITDKVKLDSLHKFVCSICSEEFRSYQRISYHMKKCEIGPYFCEVCPASASPFNSMKLLNSHKRSEHKEQCCFLCNECGHAFKFKNSLNKHKVQVHELNGSPDIFKCEICNEEFPKKVVLTNHKIQVHGQQRQFLCQICGSQFSSFASLSSHHAVTHDSYKKFQCHYCEKRFPRKDKLLHHEATHTGEKRFCCDICGKQFVRKIRLDDHRRRHDDERRYRCSEAGCLKLFASQPDLNNHLKRHAIDKEKVKLLGLENRNIRRCGVLPKCATSTLEKLVKTDISLNDKPSETKNTIPDNVSMIENQKKEEIIDEFPPAFLLHADVTRKETHASDDEEYRMNFEESPTTMKGIQDRASSLSDQELFQLGYSPSDVFTPNQQFTQSSPMQYDTTDTEGNSLMDISELDSQLYASQIDIHLSLDEDSKTLNNNLNELSDMIAQEMCHPSSFDTTLC